MEIHDVLTKSVVGEDATLLTNIGQSSMLSLFYPHIRDRERSFKIKWVGKKL